MSFPAKVLLWAASHKIAFFHLGNAAFLRERLTRDGHSAPASLLHCVLRMGVEVTSYTIATGGTEAGRAITRSGICLQTTLQTLDLLCQETFLDI